MPVAKPGHDGLPPKGGGSQMVFPSQAAQFLKHAFSLALLAALASCTTFSGEYAGIDLNADPANPEAAEIQSLARRAQAGDKYAQLELGIRYEEGDGVERDLQRARNLYKKAAADIGGEAVIYVPSSFQNQPGRLKTIKTPVLRRGLPEASRRLEILTRGMRNDF